MRPSHSRLFRIVSMLLLPGLVLGGVPVAVAAEAPKAGPELPAPRKAIPKVAPVPGKPVFSNPPTDQELFKARVFEEPLVPAGPTSAVENQALAAALLAFVDAGPLRDTAGLERFLADHPGSPWRVSLQTNLANVARRSGRYSLALELGRRAWDEGKASAEPRVKALSERAFADLAELSAKLGRAEDVQALLGEVEGRDLAPVAQEKIHSVIQAFSTMSSSPERAYRCGPVALQRMKAALRHTTTMDAAIDAFDSSVKGTSLAQLRELAGRVGVDAVVARRAAGAELVVPSVVHWKVGHFAAIVRQVGERVLVEDSVLGEAWMTQAAVEAESSGLFLVSSRALPGGWSKASDDEGRGAWGRGDSPPPDLENAKPNSPKQPTECNTGGMAGYSVHSSLVSLNLSDTPLFYSTPYGPQVAFSVVYNQREGYQPTVFTYSNLGPKWTFDWLSYVTDNPGNPFQAATIYIRGGGQETYGSFDASTGAYAPHYQSRALLVRTGTSPIRYERRMPDGSVDVYAQPDGAYSSPRKVFLTESRDRSGNALKFVYDEDLRIVAVVDALSQVTSLAYGNAADPFKITSVTDPFGRTATLTYNASGYLQKVTDVIGLTSEFTYGPQQFVTALTTPYGTTRFAWGEVTNLQSDRLGDRWIEITDPEGARERVEFLQRHFQGIADEDGQVPAVLGLNNTHLDTGLTAFWSKRAMATGAGDYSKAEITVWLWSPDHLTTRPVPRAVKKPLESRVWYFTPGQTGLAIGTDSRPVTVARRLGTTAQTDQIYRYQYNQRGQVVQSIDPVGRQSVFVYGSANVADGDPASPRPNWTADDEIAALVSGSGLDLLAVAQKNGSVYEVLSRNEYFADPQHPAWDRLVKTATVAPGASGLGFQTEYTYNDRGQVLTITTPVRHGIEENRTTTYAYDARGYLASVTGPVAGATTSYTYDAAGRLQTVTDSDAYTLTYEYDAFDRRTKTIFPDATYEQTIYNKLDAERMRDRLGRWRQTLHDSLRRVVSETDPRGATTTYQWCGCGSLDRLVDPNGNATFWERDVQNRVRKEVRQDGSATTYTYEPGSSRLQRRTDAKGQHTDYTYALDDSLLNVEYPNALIDTATVSFTYDPAYNRVRTMADGTGTTMYAYHPVSAGQRGAGRLKWVDGPLDPGQPEGAGNDVVSYSYDELGRVLTHGLATFSSTNNYDALGRLSSKATPVSVTPFTYTYDGATARPLSLTYPNGQRTRYSYFGNNQDHRLQQIKHLNPSQGVLSQFDYTYDVVGNILTWRQQYESSPAKVYEFGYDAADQLTAAVQKSTGTPPEVLKRYGWGYDKAGNRTAEQLDDAVMSATHDNRNRLLLRRPGGPLRVRGDVNEPASVTVQGQAATTSPALDFEAEPAVPTGTSNLAVQATDPSNNSRTNTYQVTQAGATVAYTYDANGNMTGDGTRTFEWDAENRLVAVKQGAVTVVAYAYSGDGRRSSIASGETISLVYDEDQVSERRRNPGSATRYVYGPGTDELLAELTADTAAYYSLDHAGSVTATTNEAGQVTLSREYGPWGEALLGASISGTAYKGREWEGEVGLYHNRARYYSPGLGRFISEDPSGLRSGDGPNLYVYVRSNPVLLTDPTGLAVSGQTGYYICCKNKKIGVCSGNPWKDKYIGPCQKKHEDQHERDLCGTDLCKDKPDGPLAFPPQTLVNLECAAYSVEWDCIKNAPDFPEVKKRKKKVLDQKTVYCNNATSPGGKQ